MEQPAPQDSAVEQSTPAAEIAAPEVEAELDPGLLDEQQPEDDEAEDELDGVKVRGKKDLIEKLRQERLMQADYTRKTQEVAEQRKAVEAQRAQVAQMSQLQQNLVDEIAEAKQIEKALEQFGQVNWAALEAQDPARAASLLRQRLDLQSRQQSVHNSIVQKHQGALAMQQQEAVRQVEQANEYLKREIKGWSDQRSIELEQYGLKSGFPKEALSTFTRQVPAFGVALHKAELYDRLVAKSLQKPPPEVQDKPVTRITATKAAANKDPDKMSTDQWLKWRESQIKRNK